jgi:hypothetical protein
MGELKSTSSGADILIRGMSYDGSFRATAVEKQLRAISSVSELVAQSFTLPILFTVYFHLHRYT